MKKIDLAAAFYIDPNSITIPPARMRRAVVDLESLKASLLEHGQIHPVTVDKNDILISGERRLTACRELEMEVWCVRREDLTKEQIFELELMENVARSDLSWDEEILAVKALHDMHMKKHGQARGKRKGWTFDKTGEKIGKSGESVRLDCYLVEAMEDLPELAKFSKKSQALSALRAHYETAIEQEILQRAIQERLAAMADAESSAPVATAEEVKEIADIDLSDIIPNADELDPQEIEDALRQVFHEGVKTEALPALRSDAEYLAEMSEVLKQGDAFELMKALPDESINLVLSDPPFGIDIGSTTAQNRIGVYDDPLEWVHDFGKKLLEECYRLLAPNAHMYMFYGVQYYHYFIEWAKEIGFHPDVVPMIWLKGKYVGYCGEPLRYPARSYEAFLLLHKGELPLAKRGLTNVLIHDPVRGENKIHETEKPVALYRDLIRRSAYPGFTILDPMAGSASSIEAALDLGYKAIGFELSKEKHAKSVHRLVRWAKAKDTQMKLFPNGNLEVEDVTDQ